MSRQQAVGMHRGSELGIEASALADYIYNGNLDDEAKIRDAIVGLVQRGIRLGYEIGKEAMVEQLEMAVSIANRDSARYRELRDRDSR